ncbi:MAG: DUF924 family protein [Xanthobacteraceae bacterium]
MRDAKAGALDHWTGTPHGTLALIILLEQFSRNLHRGSPEAFAADAIDHGGKVTARRKGRRTRNLPTLHLYEEAIEWNPTGAWL